MVLRARIYKCWTKLNLKSFTGTNGVAYLSGASVTKKKTVLIHGHQEDKVPPGTEVIKRVWS